MDKSTAWKTLIKLIRAADEFQEAANALQKEGVTVCTDFRNGFDGPPKALLMQGVGELAKALEPCEAIGFEEYTAYGHRQRSLILGDWEFREFID